MRRALPFLLAMLPLCAQDAALGARVQVVVPMGDLRDLTNGQTGLGAGVFVEIPVGNEVRLRPTLGAQYFPKKTSGSLGGADVTVSSADLLLDALWFPGGSADQGPYLVGGAGGQMWRISPSNATATSHTRLGVSGGLGYQVNPRMGLEVRAFWSPVEPSVTATGLSVAGTLRF